MGRRYSITEEECNAEIEKFFENAAKIAGYHIAPKTQFDCRKICVSKPVEKIIHNMYRTLGLPDEQIGAIWIMFGPKANLDGEELIFEIEDGFVVTEGK